MPFLLPRESVLQRDEVDPLHLDGPDELRPPLLQAPRLAAHRLQHRALLVLDPAQLTLVVPQLTGQLAAKLEVCTQYG